MMLALLAGVVCTEQAWADVIVMLNGDRITGDISRFWGDEITIEPEYADEFNVDTDMVAYVESESDFEITLEDGREVTAQFRGADGESNQVVVYDGETFRVPITQFEQVEEPDEYFDWESNIDWSSTFNSGNTDSENKRLTADATVNIGDHRNIFTLTLADEKIQEERTKNQDLFTYSYNWLFGERWFFGAVGNYERDPIRDLESRASVGAGLGRDIWDFHDRTMNFELGLGEQREVIGGVKENNSIAYWIFRFEYDLANPDLQFFHNHRITDYISGRDNTFVKSSTGVRYEITDLLYLTVSLNADYESEPALGREKQDTSLAFGAGFEF